MKAIDLRIIGLLSVLALAACQSNANQSLTPVTDAQGQGQRVAGKSAPTNLYVANASSVTVYAPGGTSVLRKISKVTPNALAFDKRGNLYVADLRSRGVLVYAAGSTNLLLYLNHDVAVPRALAFDTANHLYIGSDYSGVAVYNANSTKESRLIPVFYPLSLCFDRSGNLFVGSTTGPYGGGEPDSVEEFAPGAKASSRSIISGIALPTAVIADTSGNLFAANQSNNDVTVYAPGAKSALRTIHKGIDLPSALAFDGSGNLYVANAKGNTVTVYAPGSTSVLRTIHSGIERPKALAFDAAGDLFVADTANVTVYAPGTTSVLRTISKGVSAPVALGFGP